MLFLFVLLARPLAADETVLSPLTLPAAIDRALSNNYSLLAQRLAAHAPSMREQWERAGFRWQLTPSAEYRQEDERRVSRAGADLTKRLPHGGLLRGSADWEEWGDEQRERVELSLSQPLFRRYGREVAERGLDDANRLARSAKLELQRFTSALVLQTVEALSEVQEFKQRILLEERALVRAHELKRLVGLREKQGRASRVEVLEVDMLHRAAGLRLADVESRFHGARDNLAALLGLSGAQLPPVGALVVPDFSLPPLSEAVGMAMSNRPERALALLRYEDARRHLRLERRNLYPDLRLVTAWRPVNDGTGDTWTVGLSGGQVLDRTQARIDVGLEEQKVEQNLLQLSAVELELQRSVGNARRRVERAGLQLDLIREQERLASERLRLATRLYSKRRGDVLAVREAEAALVNVEQDLLRARIEKLRAHYLFLDALGLLVGPE